MSEYQGWANYPTWLLKVNIDTEKGILDDVCQGIANGSITTYEGLKDYLSEMCEHTAASGRNRYFEITDLWSLWDWNSVDWYHLFTSYQEDTKELGYLPDAEE